MSLSPSVKLRAGIAIVGGVGLAAVGLGSGAAYLFLALVVSEATFPLANVTTVASLAALGLGLGLPLAWYGLQAWQRKADGPFHPPRAMGMTIIFAGAVMIGQWVLSSDLAPRLLFPPLHVLAGALPAVIILVFVGRRLGQVVWRREIVGLMACSILIGGLGSIVLVGLAGLALVFFLAVLVALTPGGLETLQSLISSLQDPAWWEHPENVLSFLFTPAGLAGILLLAVVVAPLVEELLKPVGVLFIPRRPRRAEAFLWGLASASGFALTEGMFNSAVDLNAWLPVVLIRVGTSLIHCLAGGMVGLGWYSLRTARRPWQAMGLYLLAVTCHGTWNVIALSIAGLALGEATVGEAMIGLGIASLLAILGLVVVICTIALIGLVRWLRRDLFDEAATGSTESRVLPG